ncbi:tRNA (5-methylaminomethyl-2-thiouridylate)-methyltransferase [Ketobacter alkanivorans]|uniref:tRNA (5-methylaminomethyl-2-thiouridylate)-methyltransferase n=1 Tax=Ketobacter alkanivorans TaxID=1917421 RepID=A0A2K9LNN8_9GAMM|nr:tRNA (5-methylaminomethyl-2-thiouridylate)-methyltransferase [Ketobacter alkanivorans]AUM12414.1 tRNA (5-methylaminomethyl-2-thiouridylate)-methyltransferase [Ketobacter alkanivorans]
MAIQRKAIALISGGLDSMLAVKAVQKQGIIVEGVNFYTGFCVEGHTHAIRKKDKEKEKRNNSLWVAEQLGIRMNIVDISEEYKKIVLNPQHGYGANLNPCLDCKIFMVEKANTMLNKAREMAEEKGFDFIITGEVIGQRPKSQRKETMPIIARESGADDRLLRPLCAKLLPPTLPEREGWVDREQLYGFNGRSRKPQIALAQEFGLEDFAQPSGGCCFLTDESYSRKLADLWTARGRKDYELDDIMLLKVGRHIRPAQHYKVIISREEGENNFLMGYRKQFHSIKCISHGGPLSLVDGDPSEEDLLTAARIACRFSQGRDCDQVTVEIQDKHGVARQVDVSPMANDDILQSWYV